MKTATRILWLLALAAPVANAQAPQPPQLSPQRRSADSLLNAKQYAEAIAAYERLTTTEPNRPGHWFQMGMALYGVERFDQAASAFVRANSIQRMPAAQYNAAAMFARSGKPDLAFQWLDSAITTLAFTPEQIDKDPDFNAVRADPRYRKAMEGVEKALTPCMFDPNYRRLDFWIGDWDVKTLGGQQAGQSVVERIAGGCALLENWNPGRGRPGGKSINAWNAQLQQWQQYWIGGTGGVTEYRKGTWTDSSVVYLAEGTGKNGEAVVQRLTFTALKDGRVRQFAEQSVSGGPWTVQYDFYYVKRR